MDQGLDMDFHELTNEQRRQLIDVQQAFKSWQHNSNALRDLGTLRWQSTKGSRYLYEVHGGVRKSLGRETPALVRRKARHDEEREERKALVSGLTKRLDEMAPVNRALGLGRIPKIAAEIIRELDREHLLGSHTIVAGTNALYAYEAATGTVLGGEHVATTDADLLWDTSQSLSLAATGVRRKGIMGLLRRVDATFKADYGFNATNSHGYVVDLLCPETDDLQSIKSANDLEAVPMAGAEWLLAGPKLTEIIIGEDGWPLRIVVPEPRTFALHKLWVSRRPDRQPIKKPRDAAHARVVAELARKYLQKPFTAEDMPWLASELRPLLKEFQ